MSGFTSGLPFSSAYKFYSSIDKEEPLDTPTSSGPRSKLAMMQDNPLQSAESNPFALANRALTETYYRSKEAFLIRWKYFLQFNGYTRFMDFCEKVATEKFRILHVVGHVLHYL